MFRCAGGQFGCNEYSGISPICRLLLLLLSPKFPRIYPPSPNVFLVLKLGRGITELVESSVSFAILYMYEGERSHEDNNKLAKLGDAIAISKSETITHCLNDSPTH